MLRFTIRDVFWLTIVISILSLWAMERRWVSHDWPAIHRRDGQLYSRIEKQAADIRSQAKANKYLYDTLQVERVQASKLQQKLAELESTGKQELASTEPGH